jgi:ABC-type polysaccharide/polyol phosphate export permease
MLFALGICLPLAAFNLFFHDIRYLVNIGLMLWFFLTPIVYPPAKVPGHYHWVTDLNPNARFIAAFRFALLHGVSPPVPTLLLAVAIALLTLQIGYYVFKRVEPSFADRI